MCLQLILQGNRAVGLKFLRPDLIGLRGLGGIMPDLSRRGQSIVDLYSTGAGQLECSRFRSIVIGKAPKPGSQARLAPY